MIRRREKTAEKRETGCVSVHVRRAFGLTVCLNAHVSTHVIYTVHARAEQEAIPVISQSGKSTSASDGRVSVCVYASRQLHQRSTSGPRKNAVAIRIHHGRKTHMFLYGVHHGEDATKHGTQRWKC